jgi:predicted permease
LRQTPAFTLTAVGVLALAIGANTAIFGVVSGVLLRPLPFAGADRLIRVWSSRADRDLPYFSVSMPDYADWRGRSRTLDVMAAYERQRAVTLSGGTRPEPVSATNVATDLFPLLGVPPALGRWLSADDEKDGGAVIGHGLWQQRFGGRAEALGQRLALDDRVWTIVGVMPPRFEIPNAPSDVWLPLRTVVDPARRSSRSLRVLARIGAGHSLDDVRRELAQIAGVLADEHPASNRFWGVTVSPLIETVVSPQFRRSTLLLAGAVGFVLLIACANVTSLLLTRATARRREMAIRAALGASRAALVRQLLVESLMLAGASGVAGALLAAWSVEWLRALGVGSVPRLDELTFSTDVLVFAFLATLVTAVGFGLLPALDASRVRAEALRLRESSGDRQTTRRRDLLVVAEVALAFVLLVGAGLMVQSVARLQQRQLGFEPSRLLIAQMADPAPAGGSADRAALAERLLSQLSVLPGVEAAAGGSRLPFAGPNSADFLEVEGMPAAGQQRPDTDYRVVTPGYFGALGIPLLRGRSFVPGDGPRAPAVIVSASAARQYWPGRDPIGARLRLGTSPWMTVVGVAGDARYRAIDEPGDMPRTMVYVPHRQMPDVPLMMAVRSTLAPDVMVETVRAALAAANADLAVTRVEPMTAILAEEVGPQRFVATLLAVFAWIAMVLALAGLYGLIAYLVGRRTKEIGLRVALGATAREVLRLTAGRGLALSAAGVLLGAGGAWALTRLLGGVLFEVSPTDPRTFAGVAAAFLAVTAAAAGVPARRALRINPIEALRVE